MHLHHAYVDEAPGRELYQRAAAVPFEAAAHEYVEKFVTVGGANANAQPAAAQLDISPPNNQVQSYGYLRSIWILETTATNGTSAATALLADGPWNIIQQVSLTDPNGAEIYGGPTFGGYHAYLAQKYGGYRLASDPAVLRPNFSTTNPTAPAFSLRIPFEMNPLSGFGSLPNFDAQSPYKLKTTLNTSAAIFQTAPTTTPQLQFDYYIECWTLPEPVNKITGAPQQIAPVGLGAVGALRNGATVQHWTLQTATVTASAAQTIAAIRKGNIVRTWVLTARGAANARVAVSNLPNPLSFLWDGAPLNNGVNPNYHVERFFSENGGQPATTPTAADTGVIALSYHNPGGMDLQANANDRIGWQKFIGTVQSSRIEWSGTFGASVTALDILTNDVNFVDLTGSPYSFGFSEQLQAPAQPQTRT
jgi:hypothetical protein